MNLTQAIAKYNALNYAFCKECHPNADFQATLKDKFCLRFMQQMSQDWFKSFQFKKEAIAYLLETIEQIEEERERNKKNYVECSQNTNLP